MWTSEYHVYGAKPVMLTLFYMVRYVTGNSSDCPRGNGIGEKEASDTIGGWNGYGSPNCLDNIESLESKCTRKCPGLDHEQQDCIL